MPAPILITGATGTVGSRVVAALSEASAPVRAAARGPSRAGPHLVEPVRFDFHDRSTFPGAFEGVRTMFLVRPPALARMRDLEPALRAGVSAGLEHVVFLSVQGAEHLPVLPHARIERWIRSSGLTWTFLRPSFFDQNLVAVHAPTIRRDGELRIPAGRGRTAFVDAHDVGDVAAQVLLEHARHVGRAYTLTGSEALTYGEVAGVMTAVLGRTIRYTQPGLLAYARTARRDLGLSPALVVATSAIYTTARLGLAARLSTDTADLLARPPVTMAGFVRRERSHFEP